MKYLVTRSYSDSYKLSVEGLFSFSELGSYTSKYGKDKVRIFRVYDDEVDIEVYITEKSKDF